MGNRDIEKFNKAFEFHKQGQLTHARDLYEQILSCDPKDHEVWDLLGILYTQAKRFDDAQRCILKALEIKPEIYYLENLANLYFTAEDYEKASGIYEILVKNNSEYEYWFNLAMSYKNLSEWEKSKNAYYKAIELKPDSQESYFNLAYLYFNENNPSGAIKCYEKAIEINPDDWEAKYFLGLAYMQCKNYKDGLRCFEERLCRQSAIVTQAKTYPNLMKDKPIYTGEEDLSDKVLYTYYEAGFGDVIMFYRFMPELVSKCKKVIFKPQKELVPLFRENSYGAEIMDVFTFEDNIYFDYHLPFLSLPHVLEKDENTMFIHHDDGYLKPNKEKSAYFKEKYFNNDKLKIGIKWQGNTYYDKERVLKVEDFFTLFEIPDIQFYSCQTFEGAEEFNKISNKYNVIDLAPEFKDFSDTAAAVDNMDLLICNDTSLVHLAGALTKKCWVLLPHIYNWRWHNDLSKCDWYDSVRVFRQPQNGDWQSVFNIVKNELEKLYYD